VFWKVEAKGILPNSFYEASITLVSTRQTLQENYKAVSLMNIETPQQNTNKSNPKSIKRIIHHDQMGFISCIEDGFNI